MPVKFGRLGLGESPWEHVRNHAFEWDYEGGSTNRRDAKRGGTKRRGVKSGGTKKNGVPLPQPVKPAGGRHPASCLQPQQVALVIRFVLGIIVTEEIIGVRIAQRQTQRILQRRTRR